MLRNQLQNTFLLCIPFTILFPTSAAALHEANNTIAWTANWIWQEADGPENTWMCFRKSFNVTDVPAIVDAYIAVDSKYWMYVNGELVVFEGGLNRGPTPSTGYYDTINLKPYVVQGENTIAILVWYWGNEGRNNVDSGKGGLLFQSEMGTSTLHSDSSWKIKVHPAYGFVPFEPGRFNTLYLYGGWHIGFDARNDIPAWNQSDYDDSSWANATEKGVPPCAPWNGLWERPIPQWKNSGLQDYMNATLFPAYSDGNPITAKLPYNAQVTNYLKISAAPGLKIDIRTDHYEVQGYYGHRTEYITKDGVQQFESLDWQNGENVIYDIPAGIQILELKYRETGYATDFTGSFECNDDFYDLLYEKARRTLYVCMRDNYMDCPDRERGQWIGDIATQIPQTFYSLDREADKLTLKAVSDLINWRDGNLLKGLAPGAHLSEYASQSLNAISHVGIMMTYYMNTGDLTPISQSYNAIRDYLYEWSMNDDGSINSRSRWNGQGNNIDGRLLENTWYYMALKSAITMAGLTGNGGDVDGLQTRLDTMATNFDRIFWKGDGYRSGSFNDDRANALVVLSGLAGKDKWDPIGAILRTNKNAQPYMEGYVIEAMFLVGNAHDALKRMKDKYGLMVTGSAGTTLWENFYDHVPGPDWPDGTKNHAWSGAPLTSLCRYVAGINPVTAGYRTYHVLPQLGQLVNVNVVVPSIRGNIDVSINRNESQYTINLKSPNSTTAIVGIPKNSFGDTPVNTIKTGNTTIWRNGVYTGGAAGISWNCEDDSFYKFNVIPGTYNITALLAPLSVDVYMEPVSNIIAENFPNPFNAQTKIRIKIPMGLRTSVAIYDLHGYKVCNLLDEQSTKTEYQITWNGKNTRGMPVASGVYFYQVMSGYQKITEKMLLIR